MNQKELTKTFISNWKNPIWLRCFLQINSALQGLSISAENLTYLNPCAAGIVYMYIRFQSCLRSKVISRHLLKCLLVDAIVNPIIHYWRCLFYININIFRHLKLKIASAISASNEWKIETNNTAAQGLTFESLLHLNHRCILITVLPGKAKRQYMLIYKVTRYW